MLVLEGGIFYSFYKIMQECEWDSILQVPGQDQASGSANAAIYFVYEYIAFFRKSWAYGANPAIREPFVSHEISLNKSYANTCRSKPPFAHSHEGTGVKTADGRSARS